MLQTSTDELRLPLAFRKSLRSFEKKRPVKQVLRKNRLHTVCEEARCPNIGECFSHKTATFMIMGDRCTRRCNFCSVATKRPLPLDKSEPQSVAQAVFDLGLDYVVITSVDRDELPDLGANHFCEVVCAVKEKNPHTKIELLTPDFKGKENLIEKVLQSPIDVFGHNIETVKRLYHDLRPQSYFETSLNVLRYVSAQDRIKVKSGMMVGVGESDEEVLQNLEVLQEVGVQIVTIGQYLRPSLKHWRVSRYVDDNSYKKYIAHGKIIGLEKIFAGPFVRSSYRAKEAFLGQVFAL